MKTDYLDLVQLHSCGPNVLEQGEAVDALTRAKAAGKTRFVGYSGDNEEALWAVNSGLFDTLQTSFSVADQRARSKLFAGAKANGMGIIIKRPIANGVWGAESNPSQYGQEYFRRAQLMAKPGPLPGSPEDRIMLALGFVLSHPVDTAIVGTRNLEHLRSNIQLLASDINLPQNAVYELVRRFEVMDDGWVHLE